MIDQNIIDSLKERHKDLHPLVFHRSLEKSTSAVDLFEILESVPRFPFFWDDNNKKWTKTLDFYLSNKAKQII